MLFRNTVAQAFPLLSAYGFSLILAPILLDRLGLALFGVWAVTGALAQYAGLADLGVSRAIARFVAHHDASGDERGVGECLGLGLLAALVVAAVSALVAVVAAPVVADALDVLSTEDMRLVLLAAVTILAAQMAAAVINSVPVGMRRMTPPAVAHVIGNTLNFVASVTALVLSTDLVVYAWANAATAVFSILLAVGALLYVWRRPRARVPSRATAREVVRFGLTTQVFWIADLVNQQTDKIIVAALIGPRAAGAYELANRVVLAVRTVGMLAISAMVPTATAEIARSGRDVVRAFYRRYSERNVALYLPVFAAAAVSGPYLLVAWLGEAPPDSTTVLVLLTVAHAFSLASGLATALALADGDPGIAARASIIAAGLNIVLTLALTPQFGLWGVLLGTVAAMAAGALLQIAWFQRKYAIPASEGVRAAATPVALTLALAAPFALWSLLAGGAGSRPAALVGLVAVGGGFSLVYWLVAGRLGLLPEQLTPRPLRGRRRALPEVPETVSRTA